MPSVTHWLHGDCEFVVLVERETRCRWCLHSFICNHDMPFLCTNFSSFGCSGDPKTCDVCHHRYTRWATKQPIPCFHCKFFESRENVPMAKKPWREVWANPVSGCHENCWRVGIALAKHHKQVLETMRDPKVPFGGPDVTLEFIPLTENEYNDHKAKIESGEWSLTDFSSGIQRKE